MYKVVIKSPLGQELNVIHLLKKPNQAFLSRVRLDYSTKLQAIALVEVYKLEKNYVGTLIKKVV